MRALRQPLSIDSASALGPDERAIAESVLYAGLFDYPLTLGQLRQTLIGRELTPTEIVTWYDRSPVLRAVVERRDGFYYPAGRDDLIAERRRREARSRHFLRRHRTLLTLVCALPFVRMVALSGSIAHMNLDGTGDLDLFIVTRGRRVWSTAVITILLAKALRRRATVCANYVVSDERLAFVEQDLFSASQIIHLRPLVGTDVLRRLLAENAFVYGYYPNVHPVFDRRGTGRNGAGLLKRAAEILLAAPSWAGELVCRWGYGRYLRHRAATWRSPEQVRLEDDCLKLHTQSHRRSVLQRFTDATDHLPVDNTGQREDIKTLL